MTLTKDLLIELVREKMGYSVKEAKDVIELILDEMKDKLEKGEELKISGFGKWTVREKKSRPGRNPHTGKRIEIAARKVVTFHPSDKLRDSVNSPAWQIEEDKAKVASSDM
ncbi:MAG: integration host factor subunit alpha [Zetaproteobacteria bacterium]|nr:integration host factor subunit alpha [Pseudobdellovibrionaceae bacterium]